MTSSPCPGVDELIGGSEAVRAHAGDCPSCRAIVQLAAARQEGDCAWFEALIAAGTLPPGKRRALDSHLLRCAGCSEVALDLGRLLAGEEPAGEPGGASELPVVDRKQYAIQSELARGGMGRILAAHDRRTGRAVAVKELLDGSATAAARFEREAMVTARLQHPAIVPIYEVGRWPSGEPFFAMKLVPGESLYAVIGRTRTPGARLALLPKVIAVAEAMAYAHDQRIIHRDLTPANVLVGDYGETVVIDWGLAKDLSAAEDAGDVLAGPCKAGAGAAAALTQAGAVVGTVAYMPPEQAAGQPVDERADVYALGAILYHVLAGAPPYRGDSGDEVLAQLKTQPPPELPREVPADLRTIVAKAMARDPARRFPTAAGLVQELQRFQTGHQVSAHAYSLRELLLRWFGRNRRTLFGAAVALALVGASAVAVNQVRSLTRPPATATATAGVRRTVAVIGFRNLSDDADSEWIGTALTEMIHAELAAGERLSAIPAENVSRMKRELVVVEADSYAPDTLERIARNLGAGYVVVGSYTHSGGTGDDALRIDVLIQDTSTGAIVASVTERTARGDLAAAATRLGAELRERLDAGALSKEAAGAARAALPSVRKAARLYAEGLARLRRHEYLGARELLEQAAAEDPSSPLVHVALAETWRGLGNRSAAKASAKRAFELSETLGGEQRLVVEARYHELSGAAERAAAIYRQLLSEHPGTLEYGLRLVYPVLPEAKRADEALALAAALRRRPPPAGEDPSIDLQEALTRGVMGDYAGALAVAEGGIARARKQGSILIAAELLVREGAALQQLGYMDRALASLREARGIYAATGDRHGEANAEDGIGTVLFEQGHLRAGRASDEAALAIYRETGNEWKLPGQLFEVGLAHFHEGHLAEAEQLAQECLAASRASGSTRKAAYGRALLGMIAHRRGDLAGALENYQGAIDELGGDNSNTVAMPARLLVGEIQLARGDIPSAREQTEQALAAWEKAKTTSNVALAKAALATVELEAGRPREAEALARAALAEFQRENATDREASAEATLALALLEQERTEDARAAVARSTARLAEIENLAVQLMVGLAGAQIDARSGEPARHAAARAALVSIAERARQGGYLAEQLESARLLGELDLAAGRPGAKPALAAVAATAHEHGFQLIERKVHARLEGLEDH